MADKLIYSDVEIVGELKAEKLTILGQFTFPLIDGLAGQLISTDGSGNLSFVNISAIALTASSILNGTGLTWTYNSIAGTLQGDVSLSVFSTSDLPEGTNLYFTNERTDDRVASLLNTGLTGTGANSVTWQYDDAANTLRPIISLTPFNTDALSEGISNLYFTDERVDDRVSALLRTGLKGSGPSSITWAYNDSLGRLTPTVSLTPFNTGDLSEGANLYFTDERVDDRVSNLIQDSASITWTYNDLSNTLTADADIKISVEDDGTAVGTQGTLNFLPTPSATWTFNNDTLNNRIEIGVTTASSDAVIIQDTLAGTTVRKDLNNSASAYGATVSGGYNNTASGGYSTVNGGYNNTASGCYSTVSGGYDNTASCEYSTVSGGYSNSASGYYSSVGGGCNNTSSNDYAFVGNGRSNTASGNHSAVVSGRNNVVSCCYSSIGGGCGNIISGTYSVIAGGKANESDSGTSTISGGCSNCTTSFFSTVGGGRNNCANGQDSTISGGYLNYTDGTGTVVAGGRNNCATCARSTVGGGKNNSALNITTTISGGYGNSASGQNSTVSGGYCNTASGYATVISGGRLNCALGIRSTISGGYCNSASGYYSIISGGKLNSAEGPSSSITGGCLNTAVGNYSIVLGGRGNVSTGDISTASGYYAHSTRYGEVARSSGIFNFPGDAQHVSALARAEFLASSTDVLYLNQLGARFDVQQNSIFSGTLNIVGISDDGLTSVRFLRQVTIQNLGGTTTLVGSVITLGTDEDASAAVSVAVTANDLNDFLKIEVAVGAISGTYLRVLAHIDGVEIRLTS